MQSQTYFAGDEMNNMLVTGGNRGLGLYLCERFTAHSVSRSNGFDITHDRERIVELSTRYDIFVNNAYDGQFAQSWADFGQTKLLYSVAQTWKSLNKCGHIINIGGVGGLEPHAPLEQWEMYGVNKSALRHHSHQWTQAFRSNQVLFRTSLVTIDRLDTEFGRTTASWTGNGHDLEDVARMIDLCLDVQGNTCVAEITAWVNLDHKH